jgi:glycosyltransferase involved in cell wall biosynthesis
MAAVSVVVPAYNAARFVAPTLDCVLQQDHPPAEVIVVNDGSTDDTVSAVGAYAPAVNLINIQNGGPTGARLAGVTAAKCDWLAFCDADDLWHRDHLSRLVELADEHDVPFAFSNFTHIRDGRKAERSHFECDPEGFWMKPGRLVGNGSFVADQPLFARVLAYQAIFPSCTLVKRDFFTRIGGLNPGLGRNVSEDLEFTLRCVREKPAGIVVEPTVEIRRHEQNYTKDWIRTVAGSIEILKYARSNHNFDAQYLATIDREIISRSIYGIDICFAGRRYRDIRTFAQNLSRSDMTLKTATKIGVSKQPGILADLLCALLTAGSSAARFRRLLRRRAG